MIFSKTCEGEIFLVGDDNGYDNGDNNGDDKMVVPKALHNIGSTSCQHTLATLDRDGRFL